jgi:hypothetical protein
LAGVVKVVGTSLKSRPANLTVFSTATVSSRDPPTAPPRIFECGRPSRRRCFSQNAGSMLK